MKFIHVLFAVSLALAGCSKPVKSCLVERIHTSTPTFISFTYSLTSMEEYEIELLQAFIDACLKIHLDVYNLSAKTNKETGGDHFFIEDGYRKASIYFDYQKEIFMLELISEDDSDYYEFMITFLKSTDDRNLQLDFRSFLVPE